MQKTFFLFYLLLLAIPALAQFNNPEPAYLFDDSVVPRIDVVIEEEYLEFILDPFNAQSNEEFEADFYFTKNGIIDTMEQIGFRLRGNTSRQASKKSFKVSFNSFEKGRKFYGVEKLNLNGEHNDPTILRSKICWDLFAMADVPSSRSSHVALYINGEYRGLYINVEHIDEEFIQKRFYQAHGNLYKCLWPADLHYEGSDPDDYKGISGGRRIYDLKTNKEEDDYTDLAHFVDVLNNSPTNQLPCELEKVFDVDNYLKVIAIDELTSNWDGPIINKNNFYLYFNPADQRFSYIPYDLDNTLGIDWFGVDWANTDIYEWSNLSGDYRPIYERILSIPAYKDRLSYYLDKYTREYFNEEFINDYTTNKKALLYPFRINDFYANQDYGWYVQDFLDNFDEPLGFHVKYGITDYFDTRENSVFSQLKNIESSSFISKANIIRKSDQLEFEFTIENQDQLVNAEFQYMVNGGTLQSISLDFQNDQAGLIFPVTETGYMEYRLFLTSENSQTFWPLCGYKNIQLGASPTPDLVINELMSNNENYITDGFGEYDDWVELYNNSDQVISLDNYYLTDDPNNPDKWKLPYLLLAPDEYLIIWADDDEEDQGDNHASFKLSKLGEFIGIYDNASNDFEVIDSTSFPSIEANKSFARIPNGIGPFTIVDHVTFDENNGTTNTSNLSISEFSIYPNPTRGVILFDKKFESDVIELSLFDSNGSRVYHTDLNEEINISNLTAGIYTMTIRTAKKIYQARIVKIN